MKIVADSFQFMDLCNCSYRNVSISLRCNYSYDDMRPEDHLNKVEKSINTLDPDEDWELVVEGAFGSALDYIAWTTLSVSRNRVEVHSL